MNPGIFKHRIVIQKSVIVTDDIGQQTDQWQDFITIKAMIKTISGKEYFSTAYEQADRTYRFVIRYRDGITPKMIIRYDERVFNIESVINDDELDKTLTIIAKELINNVNY